MQLQPDSSLKLVDAEILLIKEAMKRAGSIVGASALLGITRHALKRRIIKHELWELVRGLTDRPEAG